MVYLWHDVFRILHITHMHPWLEYVNAIVFPYAMPEQIKLKREQWTVTERVMELSRINYKGSFQGTCQFQGTEVTWFEDTDRISSERQWQYSWILLRPVET